MQCELCGRVCDCRPATIDGVRMMLCPGCMRHGIGIKTSPEPSASVQKPILERIKKPAVKDVYKNMDKELVSGWNDLIKNARKKKGLSREELGFKIGERTVTISKIENGDLRPSDKMVKKLEKELGISLIEEVSSVSSISAGSHSGGGLTLGDFIKKEEK
ncbi:MAG: TIGR00270 family protein [Thermoplasmatales archaeon]|nr:TIGR00270 family protein [Thermoplasmatales archaeon]